MRVLLILPLFLLSLCSYAAAPKDENGDYLPGWVLGSSCGYYDYCVNTALPNHPYYGRYPYTVARTGSTGGAFYFYRGEGSPLDHYPGTVYDHVYTDEQCQAQYGTASIPANENGWFPESHDAGACSLSYVPGTGFCSTVTNKCTGDFTATSTGNTNTPGSPGSGTQPDDTPDYLTETDDPASCPAGSVSYGGQAYCVDQSAIDDGSISMPDSGGDSGSDGGGIDWGDTPSDSTPGTSTGSDGNPLGMGGGDPDGDGEGDSTMGDVVAAINGLKNTVRNGFDGIVDKFTSTDGMPTEGDIDLDAEGMASDVMADLQGKFSEAIDPKLDAYQETIESESGLLGSAINGIKNLATPFLPQVSVGSCTPIVFGSGERTFTIDCKGPELIKAALSWILFFFTTYNIATIGLGANRQES